MGKCLMPRCFGRKNKNIVNNVNEHPEGEKILASHHVADSSHQRGPTPGNTCIYVAWVHHTVRLFISVRIRTV
jgi:hypothetical protein